MNVKSVILIVAALLFAGGTAFVASRVMAPQRAAPVAQAPKEQPAKKVLVAKGNLPAGTFIKEEDVSWQKWPVDGVNDTYLLEAGRIEKWNGTTFEKVTEIFDFEGETEPTFE